MKKKFLKTFVAALALATATGTAATVTSSQPVQAISKRTWHWHWVYVINSHKRIYKVNTRKPRYKWIRSSNEYVTLEKGFPVRVRYFSNDHYFQVRASDMDEHGTWIVQGSSTKWFKNE